MKGLFFTLFFAIAVATLGLTVMVSVDTGKNNEYVPPSQRGDLTVEQENELLSEVEFRLDGSPAGDAALFIDATMISQLTAGKTVRLPLVENERCGVNLKIRNADGEWEHVHGLGCIDHVPYAAIGFTVDGMDTTVSYGAWR